MSELQSLRPEACNFIKKETLVQVFSREFCEISKNIFFYRIPPVAACEKGFQINIIFSKMISYFSGPVTGVVLGNKIPVYSLFGETYEFARVMTQYTPSEKIVVTEECRKYIRNDKNLMLQEIGGVKVQVRQVEFN